MLESFRVRTLRGQSRQSKCESHKASKPLSLVKPLPRLNYGIEQAVDGHRQEAVSVPLQSGGPCSDPD